MIDFSKQIKAASDIVKDGRYDFIKSASVKNESSIYITNTTETQNVDLSILRNIIFSDHADEESSEKDIEKACRGFCRCLRDDVLIHSIFAQKAVIRVHHHAVTAINCSDAAADYISDKLPLSAFVPDSLPGYPLAVLCAEAVNELTNTVFISNGDMYVAADTPDEAAEAAKSIINKLSERLVSEVSCDESELSEEDADRASYLAPALRMLCSAGKGGIVRFSRNNVIMSTEAERRMTVSGAKLLGYSTLRLGYNCTDEEIKSLFNEYSEKYGTLPKSVFVENLGLFVWGHNLKKAKKAIAAAIDDCRAEIECEAFGKPCPVCEELGKAIDSSCSCGCGKGRQNAGRLEGKIAIVTGAAQGFGKGIAEEMSKQGAYIVVADMNYAGAAETAAELNGATAVAVNVTDEDSVRNLIRKTVLSYGGLDVFVNNAGIVRAGSLEEMTKQNFELVTSVNYTAYFICTKYAVVPMKIQNRFASDYICDIIEINSKSGLTGSNKNFAYAGSKFGGLGLTQSFALELAPYRIKVNAVCPGNFLDGPLWSDPEKGLFVQYLNAGKVPGAKTVDDVRKFYEAKVPLNRGCRIMDVARAIFYIIEQEYETGQAVPVTGGQEMIN